MVFYQPAQHMLLIHISLIIIISTISLIQRSQLGFPVNKMPLQIESVLSSFAYKYGRQISHKKFVSHAIAVYLRW